ncbi:MAG TPA: dethiobiotin synthase [Candidatus Corynebacterium avicola]|uniref:ATP-dependent dethiobiotin synthetase BioD n=1 Tax=Candidatus Corynebacterium avicola TaxID=2838527 RepID=A0A9D1RMD4_9CORY|nr:dethiobiotin synthase [Candidatus Corynebacterium avicola]
MIILVTGTGTDVGKTVATAALASVLQDDGHRVAVVKPVQTGEPDGYGDLATVTRLTGLTDLHEFHRYPDPLAPDIAARRAGAPAARLEDVASRFRELHATDPDRVLLVEGAGGILVRMGENWTLLDLAVKLDAPVVVVTTLGLGSLNAAELTVRCALDQGIQVLGLVGGSLPEDADLATELNLAELPEVTGVPLLGALPAGAGSLAPERFRTVARDAVGEVLADYFCLRL